MRVPETIKAVGAAGTRVAADAAPAVDAGPAEGAVPWPWTEARIAVVVAAAALQVQALATEAGAGTWAVAGVLAVTGRGTVAEAGRGLEMLGQRGSVSRGMGATAPLGCLRSDRILRVVAVSRGVVGCSLRLLLLRLRGEEGPECVLMLLLPTREDLRRVWSLRMAPIPERRWEGRDRNYWLSGWSCGKGKKEGRRA